MFQSNNKNPFISNILFFYLPELTDVDPSWQVYLIPIFFLFIIVFFNKSKNEKATQTHKHTPSVRRSLIFLCCYSFLFFFQIAVFNPPSKKIHWDGEAPSSLPVLFLCNVYTQCDYQQTIIIINNICVHLRFTNVSLIPFEPRRRK